MPAISTSMRGENWSSPVTDCKSWFRCWLGWSAIRLNFGNLFFLPDYALGAKHRTFSADTLVGSVARSLYANRAPQAHAEAAPHAVLHRNQTRMAVPSRQIDGGAQHGPGTAGHQQEFGVRMTGKVFLERRGHKSVVAL